MINFNDHLFLFLNAPAHPGTPLRLAADAIAEYLIYVAMALVAALWIWGDARRRGALLATVAGISLALGINQLLGMMWYEPRPFVVGLGHTLIHHAPDNSFPSDHATFMWSLGFGLLATGTARRWGLLVAIAGFAVAWARVFLGVHFPIDMAASFLVGLAGAALSYSLRHPADAWLLPPCEIVYLWMLKALRLSPSWFPRKSSRKCAG